MSLFSNLSLLFAIQQESAFDESEMLAKTCFLAVYFKEIAKIRISTKNNWHFSHDHADNNNIKVYVMKS